MTKSIIFFWLATTISLSQNFCSNELVPLPSNSIIAYPANIFNITAPNNANTQFHNESKANQSTNIVVSTIDYNKQLHEIYELICNNWWYYRAYLLFATTAALLGYTFHRLNHHYDFLVNHETWTALLTHPHASINAKDIVQSDFVLAECTDRFAKNNTYGSLKQALFHCRNEQESLQGFCRIFRCLRWIGAGIMFPEYQNIYQQSAELKKTLNHIAAAIASLMVSRYSNRQIS